MHMQRDEITPLPSPTSVMMHTHTLLYAAGHGLTVEDQARIQTYAEELAVRAILRNAASRAQQCIAEPCRECVDEMLPCRTQTRTHTHSDLTQAANPAWSTSVEGWHEALRASRAAFDADPDEFRVRVRTGLRSRSISQSGAWCVCQGFALLAALPHPPLLALPICRLIVVCCPHQTHTISPTQVGAGRIGEDDWAEALRPLEMPTLERVPASFLTAEVAEAAEAAEEAEEAEEVEEAEEPQEEEEPQKAEEPQEPEAVSTPEAVAGDNSADALDNSACASTDAAGGHEEDGAPTEQLSAEEDNDDEESTTPTMDFAALRVVDLRVELKQRGLKTTGA